MPTPPARAPAVPRAPATVILLRRQGSGYPLVKIEPPLGVSQATGAPPVHRWVTRTTGNPVSRRVVPLVPPLLSYGSTCSRTQSRGLGIYLAIGSIPPKSAIGM